MNEFTILVGALNKFKSVKSEIEILQKNREEVYKISRSLPEMEGYRLMAIYDDSIKSLNEAWAKMNR